MRFKFTIFLLALNLIAFGLIAYLGQQNSRSEAKRSGLANQLGRELTEAERIELSGRSLDTPRVLVREGNTWELEAPMRWPANYFAVNRILNQLQFIEEEVSFPIAELTNTGQTLEDYGLADPTLKLTLSEGGRSISISIGTLTDIGNNVYLLGPDQERIYVINRQVIDGLLLDLDELRKRELFEIPVFEVAELSLQIRSLDVGRTGDLKVRLAKTAGKWSFEAPLAAEADPALVSNAINNLAAVKVGRFIPADSINDSISGLDNPFMRVTLHGNKRRQTLLVGNSEERGEQTGEQKTTFYYAKLESNPAIFTVQAAPFDELVQAQEALRERNFMDFGEKELDSIHISENGRQIRLQKIEDGRWQVLESADENELQPRRADAGVIERLIDDLDALRATQFAVDSPRGIDLERLGFNAPRRVVDLFFENNASMRLELAHPEDDNNALYARTDQAEFIYEVERRPTLMSLPLSALHYRSRTLETLPEAASVQRIGLIDTSKRDPLFEYTLDESSRDWADSLDELDAEKREAIEELIATIRSFSVSAYLKDDFDPGGYPLEEDRKLPWRYRLEATLLLPGSERDEISEISYDFTERLSGTKQIGGSSSRGTMFELTQSTIDTLYTLTEEMERPPEARGSEPESPTPIEPVPEPSK